MQDRENWAEAMQIGILSESLSIPAFHRAEKNSPRMTGKETARERQRFVYRDVAEQWMPQEIERQSEAAIDREMRTAFSRRDERTVLRRVIQATGDFDYIRELFFTSGAMEAAVGALQLGAPIVADSPMIPAGIHQASCERLGIKIHFFFDDDDVADEARRQKSTRTAAGVNKLGRMKQNPIVVVGERPTALYRLHELIYSGTLTPRLIVAVPAGVIDVVESKERILTLPNTEMIVMRGRKGGCHAAAAIVNALLDQAHPSGLM